MLGFLLCLDLIRLGLFGIAAKSTDEISPFPFLDIVVGGIHSMNVSLNRVALVADEKAFVVSKSVTESGSLLT